MPPRPARSPAPQRPTPAAKTPKQSKKAKAAEEAAAEAELAEAEAEVADAPAAAPAAAKAKAAAPAPAPTPAPAPAAQAPRTGPLVLGAFLALVLSAIAYVVLNPSKAKPLPTLSPRAFDGTNLKLSGGFAGVALVAFIERDRESKLLNRELKKTAQISLLDRLKGPVDMRIGKVYCDKHDDLCERFGVTGDDPEAGGIPQLMWFSNGTYQGPYPKEEFVAAEIKAWLKEPASPVAEVSA